MYEKAYTIKEFSEMTGVPQNTLRNWEEKLEDAFVVPRDPHENRFYSDRHLRIVELIQKWRDSEYDFSFPQIKEMLLKLREQEIELTKSMGVGSEETQVGLVPISGNGGQAQLNLVEQRLQGIEERMEAFFDRFGSMLQVQSEAIQDMVRGEIEALKKDKEERDEAFLQMAEQKIREITEGSTTTLQENLQRFNESVNAELQQNKSDLQHQWETQKEEAAKGLKEQLETQMGSWAVISKEELEVIKSQNKKKWLFW